MEENIRKYPPYSLTINAGFGEEDEIKRAMKASDLCSFIWDFQQKFKEKINQIKYQMGDVERDSIEMKQLNAKFQMIEEFEKEWYEELHEYNISLNEIYS